MNVGDIGVVVGIVMSVSVAGGTGAKYWMDHEYVPIGSLEKAFNARDVRDIRRMIRKLEYLKQNGQITPQQEWELQGLYNELGELTQ